MAKTLEEKIAVMTAAQAGKTIQKQMPLCGCCRPPRPTEAPYVDDPNPTWDWSTWDYRVKPEPRRWMMHIDKRGMFYNCYADFNALGCFSCKHGMEKVTVQEVLE